MSGIQQTQELLALLPVLAEQLKKALADGQLNVFDIPKFFPVIASARLAFEGARDIPEELKDLTRDELLVVLQQAWDGVAALVSAVVPVEEVA